MPFFAALLEGVLAVDPSAPALVFEDRWASWRDLAKVHHDLTTVLEGLGLAQDGRVGLMLRNRPGSLAGLLSVVASDRCVVAINPMLPDHKLSADIASLDLPVVVGEASDLDRAGIADALRASGAALIELLPDLGGVRLRSPRRTEGEKGGMATAPGVIIEMLTSGTTGEPKRISLKRASLETSFSQAMTYEANRRPDDAPRLRESTQILSNPLAHIGGMWGALSAVLAGRKVCLLEKFEVEAWRRAIVAHRPKISAVVPAGLRMVLDADIPREDLSSLVALRTGTAPLDNAIIEAFLDRYGIPVLQSYGATEFAGAIAGWTLTDFRQHYRHKIGSVGRLHAGVKARVIDPATLQIRATGDEGLLELQSRQLDPEGGWIRTTDMAVVDADRFLWINGRADHAIIRGGFKVHPGDVVAALESHPSVREAVVIGMKDRRLGEVPVAAVVAAAGHQPDPNELIAHVRAKLMAYQAPVTVLVVDDLPRTTSMKPSLPGVRALFEAAAELDAMPARA